MLERMIYNGMYTETGAPSNLFNNGCAWPISGSWSHSFATVIPFVDRNTGECTSGEWVWLKRQWTPTFKINDAQTAASCFPALLRRGFSPEDKLSEKLYKALYEKKVAQVKSFMETYVDYQSRTGMSLDASDFALNT